MIARVMPARPITSSGAPPAPPARRIELRVMSDPANLAAVRKQIEALALASGFDERAVAEVGLCVNEAMANIIRHAYKGRHDQPIDVAAKAEEKQLTITLRDWGNGVDPSKLPCRPYDPLEPGGVGLICLGQWMDDVIYTLQDEGMLTTLVKRRTPDTTKPQKHERAAK